MNVTVEPGKYIVAVSGGVDSVVLLETLHEKDDVDLVVAHLDHGIRPDSVVDAAFVAELAAKYGLPFETERVELGPRASEAAARQVRYNFLQKVQAKHHADAIITAHHQDDVLETALLNLLRGTGRRGITSLKSNETLLRPLLDIPKQDIIDYALKHKLSWREDSTNYDERYTRNYIRHRLLGRTSDHTRQQLLQIVRSTKDVNTELDDVLDQLLHDHQQAGRLDRQWLSILPHDVACEVMASWLRSHGVADFDRPTIERLVVQAKTRPAGKRLDVRRRTHIIVGTKDLALDVAER